MKNDTYGNLLKEVQAKVIETEEEYNYFLPIVEKLHFQKDKSAEERELYKLLVLLIEKYEEQFVKEFTKTPSELETLKGFTTDPLTDFFKNT